MKGWTEESIFLSGDKFFKSLIAEIHHATQSVDLESYSFSYDDLGEKVILALNDAVERGVNVRVLVDGIGCSLGMIGGLMGHLRPAVQMRVYHPLPWTFLLGPLRKMPTISHMVKLFFRLNRRDHRKMCLIDGRVAYLGSMNVCKSHLETCLGPRAWRDTGARVKGLGMRNLSEAFSRAWLRAGSFSVGRPGPRKNFPLRRFRDRPHGLVRLNDSWPRRNAAYRELLSRIAVAREKIWITNAYFVPHASFLRAICKASRRGVDVRLLVPRECDVIFIPWVRSLFYRELIAAGVRIYEYLPRMLHAKTIIIDQWVLVGSSNLNYRSMRHDLEVDVVMTHPENQTKLARQFLRDLTFAKEVSMEDCRHQPFLQHSGAQALFLLRNWM